MLAHRPGRVEVVIFKVGIAAAAHGASEADLLPESPHDRGGRISIHDLQRTTEVPLAIGEVWVASLDAV
jgi:hypothetical protein